MLKPERYRTIQIEKRDDGVAVATLNRPERLNAVDGFMHNELSRLSSDFDTDGDARVLVITGAGRAFCSGGDFGGAPREPDPEAPVYVNSLHEARLIVDNMLDCEKPIVSAVNGYAMGLGATVALLADVVVAARSAVFADTHVRMGISAGDGGQVIWPALIGPSRAKYYLMTGDRIGGEEAERIGLATFCVDDDQLMPRALEIAARLAAGPTYAISASKVAVNKYLRFVSNMVTPLSLAMEEVSMTKDDHREAVRAFQEKREPKFTGR
jgi:enoyl-CoA hydratase